MTDYDSDYFDDSYMQMMEEHFPIDFGAAITQGKKEREAASKKAMEIRRKMSRQIAAEDGFHDDPNFIAIQEEHAAEEVARFEEEREAQVELEDAEFRRFEEAPLRHRSGKW
jgi:hypothetical protein